MSAPIAVTPRKSPRQDRAKATVEAILGATARVLVEEGYDKATTNRIAQVAGVGIGSLYQYFPNKDALVLAVARRHSDEALALLASVVRDLGSAPMPLAVRTFVRAMLRAHCLNPQLHQVLVTQVLRAGMDQVREVEATFRTLVRAYLEAHQAELLPKDLDLAAFVLVTSVEAVTHSVVLEHPELLEGTRLEDEIVAFVLRYLLGA